jgi:hypothetical protein
MPAFDSAETHMSRRKHSASKASILISQDGARQDFSGRRALYILGFGTAGAILANAIIFGYFALYYASG